MAGVLPEGFRGVDRTHPVDIWIAMDAAPLVVPSVKAGDLGNPARPFVSTFFARLVPGASLQKAQTELDVISRMLAKEGPPGLEVTDGVGIHPLMRKRIFDPLLILTAVIALLMLLVCANLAGLLLTQAVAREREIGIRVAFGATHGRIVQQLLSESLLLGLLGGVAGIVIGRGLMKLLEIVGVAGDVRESLKTGPQSLVYRPFHQLFFPNLTLHVKTAGDDAAAAALVAPIRAELARLDPTLPIARVTLLAEEMRQGSAQPLLFSQSL